MLERLLTTHPDRADALHLRGIVALNSGKLSDAQDYLRRAVAISPDNADYRCDLGTVYHAQQLRREAEAAYLDALRIAPGQDNALFNLGNVLREQMRSAAAFQCYTKLLDRAPTFPAWNNMGLALIDMGHSAEARHCFEQALRKDPQDIQARANLALAQQEAGQLHASEQTLRQALAIAPKEADLHLNLGNVLLAHGSTDAALQSLRHAVQLAPTHSAAH